MRRGADPWSSAASMASSRLTVGGALRSWWELVGLSHMLTTHLSTEKSPSLWVESEYKCAFRM